MASYERQVELVISPDEAIHRLYGVLGSLNGAAPPRVEGPWVTTQIGISAFSWGETVAACVSPGPGRCLITIRSKSAFALIDWGRNKKHVETALARLQHPPPPTVGAVGIQSAGQPGSCAADQRHPRLDRLRLARRRCSGALVRGRNHGLCKPAGSP